MGLFLWHFPLSHNSEFSTQVVDQIRSTLSAPLSLFEHLQGSEPNLAPKQVPADILLRDLGITVLVILLIYLVLGTIVLTIQIGFPWLRQQFAPRVEVCENASEQFEMIEILRQEKRRDLVQEYIKDAIFVVLGATLSFFLNKF